MAENISEQNVETKHHVSETKFFPNMGFAQEHRQIFIVEKIQYKLMTKLFNKLKKNIYILAIFWAKFFYPENSAVKNNLRKRPGRRNGRRADPVL